MVGAGDAARHADRHPGRHLPRRVRPARLARRDDALHQRHPAVGAVDRDRPVRLRGGRRAHEVASPAGPASLALALIVIPVVIRTTENMLQLVPNALREAAYALGAPKWKVIAHDHADRAARAGIVTGILLALARISGETAPLLFTALNNQFWTTDLSAADGQPAGDDLQVRDEPVRELAEARLGRRVPHHPRRAGAQHPGARCCSATSTDAAEPRRAPMDTKVDLPTAEPPKLSVRDLNFYYGSFHALKDINLDIPEQARSPPSSAPRAAASRRCCAPSTACSSSIPSSAPRARSLLDGENILDLEAGRLAAPRQVGMVFQKPTPFPMSIYDNIAFGVRLFENAAARRDGRARRVGAEEGGAVERGEGQAAARAARACRAASSSGCASRAASRSSPRCCCSTSRARRSTRSPPARSRS